MSMKCCRKQKISSWGWAGAGRWLIGLAVLSVAMVGLFIGFLARDAVANQCSHYAEWDIELVSVEQIAGVPGVADSEEARWRTVEQLKALGAQEHGEADFLTASLSFRVQVDPEVQEPAGVFLTMQE